MDKARRQTDAILKNMENEMGRIYKNDPALKRIQKEYAEYMEMVQEQTEEEYKAYKADPEQKQAYIDKVRSLTTQSAEYKRLIRKITSVLAEVNQKALDVCNDKMVEIYTINYNQVADDCKKVGIKVNG